MSTIDESAPTIEATEGTTLRVRCVFGSSRFKQLERQTLLGWDATGTRLRLLTAGAAAWIDEYDAASGALVRSTPVPADILLGVGVGRSLALLSTRPEGEGEGVGVSLWDAERVAPIGALGDVGRRSLAMAASEDARVAFVDEWNAVAVYELPGGARSASVSGGGLMAASTDGEMFAVRPSAESSLRVSRSDGSTLVTLKWGADSVLHAASFGRDGLSIAAGFADGSVACWELPSGTMRWRRRVHDEPVLSVARAPDGACVSACAGERICAIDASGETRWLVELRRPRSLPTPRVVPPSELAVSPDGALVAVATRHPSLRIFETATGQERSAIDGHDSRVTCLALSADGRLVASGGADGDVRVGDARTGETLWVLEAEGDEMTCVEFLPDRPALWTGGRNGVVRRWNLTTGSEEGSWPVGPDDRFRVRASLDGSRALVRSGNRLEHWSDLGAERVAWSAAFGGPSELTDECFGRTPPQLLVCLPARGDTPQVSQLDAYDLDTGDRRGLLDLLEGDPLSLQETERGPVAVMIRVADGAVVIEVVELWDERRVTRLALGEVFDVGAARLSIDGRWLALQVDATVEVWSLVEPARRVGRVGLGSIEDRPTTLAVSADGAVLAVGTVRGCVLVFERAG